MLTKDCFEIKILDHVLHSDVDEILRKIRKGSIVRADQVRVGEQWVGIDSIPEFASIFDALEREHDDREREEFKAVFTNFQVKTTGGVADGYSADLVKRCAVHGSRAPEYVCIVCENLFCAECPINETGRRICPFCGGRCVLYLGQSWHFEEPAHKAPRIYKVEETLPFAPPEVEERLVLIDLAQALWYSFRFLSDLIVGGLLSGVFVFGFLATTFDGGLMLAASAVIVALSTALHFKVLQRMFENFSNTEAGPGFLPRADGFSLRNDLLKPLSAGASAFATAFGTFAVSLFIVAAVAWMAFEKDGTAIAANSLGERGRIAKIIDRGTPVIGDEAKVIIDARLRQMESVFGRNHLVENTHFARLMMSLNRLTIWLQAPLSVAFLLGVILFPAACINSSRGGPGLWARLFGALREMRRIGFDYLKILVVLVGLIALFAAALISTGLLFSRVEAPVAGFVISLTLCSFLAFYFWAAFGAVLAIARCKSEVPPT